ncbi:MAG: hypothetical protein HYZ42_12535 [Bacteroidetes bacterium]|nr:hypothetical protein [Bacteroidota bacterium]
MSKKISQIISVIFHPSVLQLFGYLLIWYFYPDYKRLTPKGIKSISIAILIFTWGIPLLMYLLLKLSGRIKSFLLEDRAERNLPYLITTLSYLACWRLFSGDNVNLPGLIVPYTLASACVVAYCGVLNYFDKVSAHAAGCGGLLALTIFTYFFGHGDIRMLLALVLIISGLVISARKNLNAHTDKQLALGYIGGFVVSFVALFLPYVNF